MREPAKIAAAVEIAGAVRRTLAEELERRREAGWEDDILRYELGRAVGALLRWEDTRPSGVEHLVEALRRAHAGLMSPQTPEAEDVVRELCPEAAAEAGGAPGAAGPTVQ